MPAMKMKNPEQEKMNNFKKQIEYWKNKCGLKEKEVKKILSYAEKTNIEPSRIIETIALNATNEDGNWGIRTKVHDYDIAIESMQKELNEIKKKPKEQKPKSKFVKFLEKIDNLIKKEDYENILKRKIERYKRIRDVLNEFSNDEELIKKIKEKSGIKTKDEML